MWMYYIKISYCRTGYLNWDFDTECISCQTKKSARMPQTRGKMIWFFVKFFVVFLENLRYQMTLIIFKDTKVSYEHIHSWIKFIILILYPRTWNSITCIAIQSKHDTFTFHLTRLVQKIENITAYESAKSYFFKALNLRN